MTIIAPLLGGLMIGTSAGLYLLFTGRIAGISGVAASALGLTGTGISRLGIGFIAGIMAGAALAYALLAGTSLTITSALPLLVLGGLLTGFGTRLGSGCTSGHGVCGMARLSPRSIAATGVFMAVAALTVFVTRHLVGGI